jgi:hypothetical protein
MVEGVLHCVKVLQAPFANTHSDPLAPQSVQKIINPSAGPKMTLRWSKVIRGNNTPLVVLDISSAADGAGELVPMPTFPLL